MIILVITAFLQFLDEARAVQTTRQGGAFLRRNLRRGVRRLRSYAVLNDALIHEEADESRESTPSDDSDDDADAETPTGGAGAGATGIETRAGARNATIRLQPRVPRVDDRETTSFLIFDGIQSVVTNTAFGESIHYWMIVVE